MSDRYKAFADDDQSASKKLDVGLLDDEDEPDQRDVDGLDDVLPPPPSRRGCLDKISAGLCCLCSAGDIMSFRSHWVKRTILTDWFVTWLSRFVDYCQDKAEVQKEFLHFIPEQEKAAALYDKWCV